MLARLRHDLFDGGRERLEPSRHLFAHDDLQVAGVEVAAVALVAHLSVASSRLTGQGVAASIPKSYGLRGVPAESGGGATERSNSGVDHSARLPSASRLTKRAASRSRPPARGPPRARAP